MLFPVAELSFARPVQLSCTSYISINYSTHQLQVFRKARVFGVLGLAPTRIEYFAPSEPNAFPDCW